jgi:transposase
MRQGSEAPYRWELELELNAQLEGSDWVTLERRGADTDVFRAALRNWYRTGRIPSRLAADPHGPQRLVPFALAADRAEARRACATSQNDGWPTRPQLEILRHRVDQLEPRLAALERQ